MKRRFGTAVGLILIGAGLSGCVMQPAGGYSGPPTVYVWPPPTQP